MVLVKCGQACQSSQSLRAAVCRGEAMGVWSFWETLLQKALIRLDRGRSCYPFWLELSLAQLKLFGCFAFLQLIYIAFSTTIESKQLRISPIVTTSSEVLGFDWRRHRFSQRENVESNMRFEQACHVAGVPRPVFVAHVLWMDGVSSWLWPLVLCSNSHKDVAGHVWWNWPKPQAMSETPRRLGWLGTLTKCVCRLCLGSMVRLSSFYAL